ncbi:VOC family protein [uncultured Phenylobacterium sp.]|uniref:VOC family protein n=1 Tax=uncultured Phenylobacterium sp. TaxID=349273 RepID=UPI0025E9B562|nr:VOC family protein [uncultured Phenylobacterium sp.]
MRVRQVALVAGDLDRVTDGLNTAFGLKVAYNDPGVGHYGLKNAVLPAGAAFIEVVEPVRDDASAGRYLKRRGGEAAGYMVILQCADAPAEQARAEALGVRVVDQIDRPYYYCAHFHPADFGGMLVSFDQQRTETDPLKDGGDWMPAGPDWAKAQADAVDDITAVVMSAADPLALARRWSELIGRPLDPDDPLRLPLDRGEVRFVAGGEGAATAIEGLDVAVTDPEAVLSKAKAAGLEMANGGVRIGGVVMRPTAVAR